MAHENSTSNIYDDFRYLKVVQSYFQCSEKNAAVLKLLVEYKFFCLLKSAAAS